VNALRCAVDIQEKMAERNVGVVAEKRIEFRMGINVGDVIIEGGDIFGDGVNLAARLEALADPGGICVSDRVREDARGKLNVIFEDLGEQWLKNIAKPVRVYRVRLAGQAVSAGSTLPAPEKPSIAVLPFQNLSGDREQEYFADGIVEEIITALSRFRQLFVIARNSSFTYKGRAVDVKQVGRDLGVRYVLEGSVRRATGRVRITGQLIDTATGAHLWADRFDGALVDIFELQDEVTGRVVAAIAPKLEEAEIERAKRKPTESLDAYDEFLRGMAGFHRWSQEGNDEGLRHFYEAIRLDPNYAAACGMAARMYVQRNSGGWISDRAYEVAETERLAMRAAELGRDDAVALATAGFALSDILGLIEDGDAMIDRALGLNPNLAWVWLCSSWVKASLGDPETALERIEQALRLSPNDPQTSGFHAAKGWAQLFAGRFGEAFSSAEAAIRQRPGFLLYMCIAAVSAALEGRAHEAERIVSRMLQANPALTISKVSTLIPLRRQEDIARWVDGLRKARLPE
jgi:adenylate cyclase